MDIQPGSLALMRPKQGRAPERSTCCLRMARRLRPAGSRRASCTRPAGRSKPAWETSVADERAPDIHVHDGVSEEAFVKLRRARAGSAYLPYSAVFTATAHCSSTLT